MVEPLVAARQRDRVESLVESARAEGATLAAGVRRPHSRGGAQSSGCTSGSRRKGSMMAETMPVVSTPLDRAKAMLDHALPANGGGTLEDRREGYEAVLAQLPIPEDASITAATYGGIDGYWVRAAGASTGRIGVMLHRRRLHHRIGEGLSCLCCGGVTGNGRTGLRGGVPSGPGTSVPGGPRRCAKRPCRRDRRSWGPVMLRDWRLCRRGAGDQLPVGSAPHRGDTPGPHCPRLIIRHSDGRIGMGGEDLVFPTASP
ncbi:hypothetical protein SAMN05444745_12913 [Arthrobacter sp. OV608]|nr:hypothetical protein SAMN05444745_12913 [Arthrobacter sp. OV608]